jgi:hypothetical protein
MDIAIDFDGTCTTHEFPKVGQDIGAIPVLRELVNNGHRLILFTMRSDRKELSPTGDDTIIDVAGDFLTDAINWFKDAGIPLYGIQSNPTQKNWTSSPKCYAQLYIDDAALGCPLIHPGKASGNINGRLYVESERPYVDWYTVRKILVTDGLIK